MSTKQRYDHRMIEQKWQKYWEDHHTFKTEVDRSKPKYYILDMFPYPSGAGLHVGHVTGYTATDIIARYKRQRGYNVLHPIGWDSFGLPAEQYAIRTGTHPAITTQQNINNYRRQLKSLGFSYDWSREFATSDPRHYKWTQWIFTKLYEQGLAYEAEVLVNFCPALGTVLANEEIENGKSKEGGYPIERRPLRQWILRITNYAERLLDDLELVDWPENIKKLQINWIGKSVGAKATFVESKTKEPITVFTTTPETLAGTTFLVLAPEHPLIESIVTHDQKKAVHEYQKKVSAKSDLERTDLAKEKTGVWTGATAINPVNGKSVPIWIADYVLMHYGTGAIMAVPAHDERDFEFAKLFGLPIEAVIDPEIPAELPEGLTAEDFRIEVLSGNRCWSGPGTMIHAPTVEGLDRETAKLKITAWLEEHKKGEKCITYRLRDWIFSRQRYWGEPFPILHFADGTKRALDIDELPLTPPEVKDYKPTPTGESPFATVRNWVEITDPKTGKKATRETNTMPQWAGSCWYYLRFCDPNNHKEAWGKEPENYWMPVDLYVGGTEHAVLHLLYSRFWHKVLYDIGEVSTLEPFHMLRNQGMVVSRSYQEAGGSYVPPEDVIEKEGHYFRGGTNEELRSQIEKMSKSKLNGVTPDEMIEEYGADSLRLYEMFMGPFDKEKVWNTDAVTGCKRFLNRSYDLIFSDKVTDEETPEGMRLAHKVSHDVSKAIETFQFNTAIAKMMEFLNDFSVLPSYPKHAVEMFIQALYPFAPHLAEEGWQHLGHKKTITFEPLTEIIPEYLVDETVIYVIQVNGKLRGRFELPKDRSEGELLSLIKTRPDISKHITGEISKVVFVPNKLLNLVVHVAQPTV